MWSAASLGLLVLLCCPVSGAESLHVGYEAFPKPKTVKPVRGIAFSADGKWLVSGGEDGRLRVWNLSTGRQISQKDGQRIRCLATSPAGDFIAACPANESLYLLRIDAAGAAQPGPTLDADGNSSRNIAALAWSRNGEHLYSANERGVIEQWQVRTRSEVKLKTAGGNYSDLSVAPDERVVIAAGVDRTFRLVEFTPRRNELHFDSDARAAAFLDGSFNSGYTVAMGNGDGSIGLFKWIARTPPEKGSLTLTKDLVQEHGKAVRKIVSSPDGSLWASSARSGEVALWTQAGQVVGRGRHNDDVRTLAFSRDGNLVASASEDGIVKVWAARPFRHLATLVSFADGAYLTYESDGSFVGDAMQIGSWRKDGEPASQPALNRPSVAIWPASTPGRPPASSQTNPPPADRSLTSLLAAAEHACRTGNLPPGFNVDARRSQDATFLKIANNCANDAEKDTSRVQAWMADADKQYGCPCLECGGETPPPEITRQAEEYRTVLRTAQSRYSVARFARTERDRASDGSRQAQYQLGMIALCYLGPPQEAAQHFDAVRPPYLDSQDRARQAYARLALSRSITAMKESNFDEALKQLGYFRPQIEAIQPDSEIRAAEEADVKRADALEKSLRGKRLYRVGMNAIKEGRLADGRASLSEAQSLVPPGDPESQSISGLLEQLQRQQATTKRIESAVQDSQQALNSGDLGEAKAKALEAIRMAGPDTDLVGRAQRVLTMAESQQKKQRQLRWGILGGALLILLVVYAIPTARSRIYSAVGLRQQAARVNLKLMAANPTNAAALQRLFVLRDVPVVSERLAELFQVYLARSPKDGKMAYVAGQWAMERGDESEAADLLGSALALGVTDTGLFRALLRLPTETVQAGQETLRLIAKRQPEQREAALALARHYMAEGSIQPEALSLYETVLKANPDDHSFRLDTVRALLRAASPTEALRHLEILLERRDADRPTLDALVEAARGQTTEAIRLLESPMVSDFDRLNTGETLAETYPECRSQVDALYRSKPAVSDALLAAVMRVHRLAGVGDTAGAAALAESAVWPGSEQEKERMTQIARALRRIADPRSANLSLALARTEAARGDFAAAFAELEALRQRQSLTAEAREEMLRALGRMSLRETAIAFFRQAGWRIDGDGDEIAPPATADPQVSRQFAKAPIHYFDNDLEAQDVLDVRDRVQNGGVFLVTPEKPRRDVYALLYATLVEFRDLSMIPLDRATIKAAVSEEGAADVLLQALNLWLGRGDVFDERNPISDSAAFFGRGPLIHQLLNKILNRQNFGLYGLRKMGKTSLIFQLREGLPSNIRLVYIDLQGIASGTCAELCSVIADELRNQMNAEPPSFSTSRRTPLSVRQKPLLEALSEMDAALSAALTSMGQGRQDARILLVLDEIERMIPHDGHPGFQGFQEFFRLIRGMYQQRRQVVSAVVGADPTLCRLGKWEGVDNPVFQYYDEVFLAPLDRGECDAMVQGLAAILGVNFQAESLRTLYAESAGHPFITRQLCSRIVQRYRERPLEVTPKMVAAGVAEYLELRSEYLREIFEYYLSENAQAMLEGIAGRSTARLDRAGLDQVIAESLETPEAGMHALQELELFHLLIRHDDGFEMPMGVLMRYLRSDWTKSEFTKAN